MNQLGNVIVVDNIDTMNKVAKLTDYKYKVVTLDGEVQYSGGAINGGSVKTGNSLLNEKYEIENLQNEIKSKNGKLQKYEDELKE